MLLLLNNGKGSEFNGKSLAETEVANDIIECEEDGEIDGSVKKELKNKKKTRVNYIHINIDQNQVENTTSQLSADSEENKASNSSIQYPHMNNKTNRIRWVVKEKQLHFKEHIQTKTAPKKNECLNFIDKNLNSFSHSDWVRIKTLVLIHIP